MTTWRKATISTYFFFTQLPQYSKRTPKKQKAHFKALSHTAPFSVLLITSVWAWWKSINWPFYLHYYCNSNLNTFNHYLVNSEMLNNRMQSNDPLCFIRSGLPSITHWGQSVTSRMIHFSLFDERGILVLFFSQQHYSKNHLKSHQNHLQNPIYLQLSRHTKYSKLHEYQIPLF